MFLLGLKFALGFAAGLSLCSGVFVLALVGAELLAQWRKRRQCGLYAAKARAPQSAMPPIRERAVFCFCFRTNDWIPTRDKTKYVP